VILKILVTWLWAGWTLALWLGPRLYKSGEEGRGV